MPGGKPWGTWAAGALMVGVLLGVAFGIRRRSNSEPGRQTQTTICRVGSDEKGVEEQMATNEPAAPQARDRARNVFRLRPSS